MIYKYNEFLLEFKKKYNRSDRIEDFADLYIERIAKKLNVKLVKRLGSGSFGIAYLVDKDKVIKVTTDRVEAENARKLMDYELVHFLNYYDVQEITLDNIESTGKEGFHSVYFILMDYVKPIPKEDWKYWENLNVDYFSNLDDESFLDNVHSEFLIMKWNKKVKDMIPFNETESEKALEYFKPFMKQRHSILEEGSDYGISFSDAHVGNLGLRRDGTLVYFDIGYGDNVVIYGEGGESKSFEIDKVNFDNDYKKIKKMLIDNYKPDMVISISDVLWRISKLLNINRVKSYKYLRDEIWAHEEKSGPNDYESPIFFVARNKGSDWLNSDGEYENRYYNIHDHWKKNKMDIGIVFTDDYKNRTIERNYGMRKLKPKP